MPTPKTILIIDDDDDLREALAEQLNLHEEFKTQQAATATDGVRMGREIPADLILLDVDLPDMDGHELLRRLRAQHLPAALIALSANAMPEAVAQARAAGFDDYWTKPIDVAQLLDGLDRQASSNTSPHYTEKD